MVDEESKSIGLPVLWETIRVILNEDLLHFTTLNVRIRIESRHWFNVMFKKYRIEKRESIVLRRRILWIGRITSVIIVSS